MKNTNSRNDNLTDNLMEEGTLINKERYVKLRSIEG